MLVKVIVSLSMGASPDGWAVWRVVLSTRWWFLVDHCVLRNWDRILVRAVKGLISRAGMVSICPLLWQRDVKLQQTNKPFLWVPNGLWSGIHEPSTMVTNDEGPCWIYTFGNVPFVYHIINFNMGIQSQMTIACSIVNFCSLIIELK